MKQSMFFNYCKEIAAGSSVVGETQHRGTCVISNAIYMSRMN